MPRRRRISRSCRCGTFGISCMRSLSTLLSTSGGSSQHHVARRLHKSLDARDPQTIPRAIINKNIKIKKIDSEKGGVLLLRVGGHSERLHGSTERIVRNMFVDVFGIFVYRWRIQACERFVGSVAYPLPKSIVHGSFPVYMYISACR